MRQYITQKIDIDPTKLRSTMDKIREEKDLSVKTFKKKTWFHYDTIIKAYSNGYIGRTVIKFLKKMKVDINVVASKPLLQADNEDIKE